MEGIIDFLTQVKDFLNPKFLIDYMLNLLGVYVYFGLWFVVFAETGLAVGFFLPGDSMLVVTGLFAAAGKLNVALVLFAFFLGSVIGDSTGYWTGRFMGKTLFNRESSRIFKPSRVEKAHAFFEKYGPKTVVLARFVPIVRTFAPLVIGAADMPYSKFPALQPFRRPVMDQQHGVGRLFPGQHDRAGTRHQAGRPHRKGCNCRCSRVSSAANDRVLYVINLVRKRPNRT
jgi:membrane protein DedA with SNARE-associated domain